MQEFRFQCFASDSSKGLGHEDVVARGFERDVWGKGGGTSFEVAEVTIELWEGSAGADDSQIDGAAARVTQIVLRRVH